MSIPIFSFSTPFSVEHLDDRLRPSCRPSSASAVSDHFQVIAGRMLPFSQGASIFAHSRSEPAVSNSTGSPPRGSTQ